MPTKSTPSSKPTPLNLTRRRDGLPLLMGVLNVTPDSFFDGGRTSSPDAAIERARQLIEAGTDLLDVGGESSRPGAEPVPESEEKARVLPIFQALREKTLLPLSIDTTKASVARAALESGASLINDISALRADPEMAEVARRYDCPVILMHMQGTPQMMQQAPSYRNVVQEVLEFFQERLAYASRKGISKEKIILDPGIGFGKKLHHNLALLKNLERLRSLGCPVLVGASRKSFIAHCMREMHPDTPMLLPDSRLPGSLAVALWAAQKGVDLLRVHDPQETLQALTLFRSLENALSP